MLRKQKTIMSDHQNARPKRNRKTADKSSVNVAELKYFE
jgi:hypothetical protein